MLEQAGTTVIVQYLRLVQRLRNKAGATTHVSASQQVICHRCVTSSAPSYYILWDNPISRLCADHHNPLCALNVTLFASIVS
jgi:hypothetical protein